MTQPSPTLRQITLVGPPNAGKTTLFNALTGSNYKTVNYPGSTVSYCEGSLRKSLNLQATVKDTPGITTLFSTSPDQQITTEQLFGRADHDLILAVIDATQLTRHLYLIDQLKEVGFEVLVCLTMLDLLQEKGQSINVELLQKKIQRPVIALDPRKPAQIKPLIQAIVRTPPPSTSRPVRTPASPSEKQILTRFQKVEAIEQQVIQNIKPTTSTPFDPDRILLHPLWGGICFMLIMFMLFFSIFWLADNYFMGPIDTFFGFLIDQTKALLPNSWLTDLLADGLIAGIGAVLIFLPQIIILFLLLGYLEDTGYLARAATICDKPLSKIGLNGKAFVPLLSGFACAIPAMMATRSIVSRKERLLTIFIIPLMSCSARLPIYVILISFLIRDKAWLGGLIMTALYFAGILAAAIVATLAAKLPAFRKAGSHFMLELPAYRRPQFKLIAISTYHRSKQYIKKAGLTIVVIALALWLLTHLPVNTKSDSEYIAVSQSYAAKMGKFFQPIFEPMGLDWRGGVAMTMGFAAREVFVGSLALMYRIEDQDEQAMNARLLKKMEEATFEGTNQKIFTTASTIGILFFFIIALQCFPTVVTAKTETGSWKLPLIQLTTFTGTAYLGAVIIVQSLRAIGIP
jgi:ferrous iron transport protein B